VCAPGKCWGRGPAFLRNCGVSEKGCLLEACVEGLFMLSQPQTCNFAFAAACLGAARATDQPQTSEIHSHNEERGVFPAHSCLWGVEFGGLRMAGNFCHWKIVGNLQFMFAFTADPHPRGSHHLISSTPCLLNTKKKMYIFSSPPSLCCDVSLSPTIPRVLRVKPGH